jgi:hypothetical protein
MMLVTIDFVAFCAMCPTIRAAAALALHRCMYVCGVERLAHERLRSSAVGYLLPV